MLWVALILASRLLQAPFIDHPRTIAAALGSYFAVFCLVVFPWQVVGVLRAGDRYLVAHGNALWVRAAQLAVVAGIAAIGVIVIEDTQSLALYRVQYLAAVDTVPAPPAGYTLTVSSDGSQFRLQGAIELGVTRRFAEMLRHYPRVTSLALDSRGGNIFAARGLATLIQTHHLNTYSDQACESACAIVYAAGAVRTLAAGARLGFHQYRLDALNLNPLIDLAAQQDKDRSFYRARQISGEFIDRIYRAPADQIWYPTQAELLAAGVVHHIVDPTPAQ